MMPTIPLQAQQIARRLVIKAASRIWRLEYTADSFTLSLRTENGAHLAAEARCFYVQDSFTFLGCFTELWDKLLKGKENIGVKKVSITLCRLKGVTSPQGELFRQVNRTGNKGAQQI